MSKMARMALVVGAMALASFVSLHSKVQAGAADWVARKLLEKIGGSLVPKEGKLQDSTLDGPEHKRIEREKAREIEKADRKSRTS